MTMRVSAREAGKDFAELADRVRDTGEPIIVEEGGRPLAALVSLADLDAIEQLRRARAAEDFTRLAARAARERSGPEPSEDEIVAAVKETRAALFRERYGS
jgi:prevent-host-death family protein